MNDYYKECYEAAVLVVEAQENTIKKLHSQLAHAKLSLKEKQSEKAINLEEYHRISGEILTMHPNFWDYLEGLKERLQSTQTQVYMMTHESRGKKDITIDQWYDFMKQLGKCMWELSSIRLEIEEATYWHVNAPTELFAEEK